MARPGRPEAASVPIWLKLSETDAAQMEQVLARPEFAGWTRAEWCLEIIQTALRYYTRTRPAAEPGRQRAPAQPAPAEPEPPAAEPERRPAEPERAPGTPEPVAPAPEPMPPAPDPPAMPEPPALPEPLEPPALPECSHPADARDYQSGTCAACGAILWD